MTQSRTGVLGSAEAKFRNGSDHLETLRGELLPWADRNILTFALNKNAEATECSLIFRWTEEPPIERWGLLIGDCLHNLRSSLDHAVYALAVAKSGNDPLLHGDDLAFPICDTDRKFKGALGRNRLGDLASDKDVRAAVESLQPYRRPNPPYVPLLATLRDLENRDKHKIIQIVAAALRTGQFEMSIPDGGHARLSRIWTHGPIQTDTKLVTLIFDRPTPDVKVSNPNLRIFLAIEVKTLGGTRRPVALAIVEDIRDEVRYCLDALGRLL